MTISDIQIKPITNEAEFEEANKIIDALIDSDLIEDPIERQRASDILEAVAILAIEYEKKHYPIPKPNPIKAIKERLEQLDNSFNLNFLHILKLRHIRNNHHFANRDPLSNFDKIEVR